MYPHAHGNGTQNYVTSQGYVTNSDSTYGATSGYALNAVYTPAPGYAVPQTPTPPPAPPTAPAPTAHPPLAPVQVPPGCYPIELVQFWREHKPNQPFPLHWALFVRTAPPRATRSSPHSRSASLSVPVGNFYELVGTPDTYTAQFLPNVTFEPSALADWRGTHVVGWVSPGQLGTFEHLVRQVPVWRHRADWRCQQWVYDVVRAVGVNDYPGVFIMIDGVTLGGLQRHMERLMEAWECGDI